MTPDAAFEQATGPKPRQAEPRKAEYPSKQSICWAIFSAHEQAKTLPTLPSPPAALRDEKEFLKGLRRLRRRAIGLFVCGSLATISGLASIFVFILGWLLFTGSPNWLGLRISLAAWWLFAFAWCAYFLYRGQVPTELKTARGRLTVRQMVFYLVALLASLAGIAAIAAWCSVTFRWSPPTLYFLEAPADPNLRLAICAGVWFLFGVLVMLMAPGHRRLRRPKLVEEIAVYTRLISDYEVQLAEVISEIKEQADQIGKSDVWPAVTPRAAVHPVRLLPSASLRRIRSLLDTSDRAAIGVGGAPGSGKTSALAFIKHGVEAKGLPGKRVLAMQAPAEYEPLRFVTDLALQVCAEIGRAPETVPVRKRTSRKIWPSLILGAASLKMGVWLALFAWPGGGRAADIDSLMMIPAMVCFGFAGVAIRDLFLRGGPPWITDDQRAAARSLSDELRFVVQSEREQELSFGAGGSGSSATLLNRVRSTVRQSPTNWTAAEVRRRLRAVLDTPGETQRLLVLVDDADTLQPCDQASILREMQGSLGGAHVAVSWVVVISVDCESLIHSAGYLNTVTDLEPLTPRESFDLIRTRCPTFPLRAGALIHVFSEGNPRFLLALANKCVNTWSSAQGHIAEDPELAGLEQVVLAELRQGDRGGRRWLRCCLRNLGRLANGSGDQFGTTVPEDFESWCRAAIAKKPGGQSELGSTLAIARWVRGWRAAAGVGWPPLSEPSLRDPEGAFHGVRPR